MSDLLAFTGVAVPKLCPPSKYLLTWLLRTWVKRDLSSGVVAGSLIFLAKLFRSWRWKSVSFSSEVMGVRNFFYLFLITVAMIVASSGVTSP
jgi:hypothetical protein